MDDRAIAAQRLAAPVDSDERKQAMLDLVPLAGAGRQVANRYGKLELVGQFALKICHKGWVLNRLLLAPTACLADASRRSRHIATNVGQSMIDRRSRQPADPRHQADPATS